MTARLPCSIFSGAWRCDGEGGSCGDVGVQGGYNRSWTHSQVVPLAVAKQFSFWVTMCCGQAPSRIPRRRNVRIGGRTKTLPHFPVSHVCAYNTPFPHAARMSDLVRHFCLDPRTGKERTNKISCVHSPQSYDAFRYLYGNKRKENNVNSTAVRVPGVLGEGGHHGLAWGDASGQHDIR